MGAGSKTKGWPLSVGGDPEGELEHFSQIPTSNNEKKDFTDNGTGDYYCTAEIGPNDTLFDFHVRSIRCWGSTLTHEQQAGS